MMNKQQKVFLAISVLVTGLSAHWYSHKPVDSVDQELQAQSPASPLASIVDHVSQAEFADIDPIASNEFVVSDVPSNASDFSQQHWQEQVATQRANQIRIATINKQSSAPFMYHSIQSAANTNTNTNTQTNIKVPNHALDDSGTESDDHNIKNSELDEATPSLFSTGRTSRQTTLAQVVEVKAKTSKTILNNADSIVSSADSSGTSLASNDGSPEAGEHIADDRQTVRSLPEPETSVTTPVSKVIITSPSAISYTNSANAVISGSVELERNLDGVTVNGQSVNWREGTFTANVRLNDGFNVVTASADYGRRKHVNAVGITLDTVSPSTVSALSASSNSVVLQFNEAMRDDVILSTSNFNIVDKTTLTALPVRSASFVDPSQTAVILETGVQSSAKYTLTVTKVKDLAGNTIREPQTFVTTHPAIVDFTGTSPSGSELVDSDDDGLDDHIELAGWVIVVEQVNGVKTNYFVYSDPYLTDTDGDGVGDADEYHGSMNPRSFDTDGDSLSDDLEWNSIYSNPSKQDTDGDGIEDGFEYVFFKTSPIFADTDGDQISDPDEIVAGNRNPLIADLPSPRIVVGDINMQLDTRFTTNNEKGIVEVDLKTVEATISKSENESFSRSNETSSKNTIGTSQELAVSANAGGDGSAFPSYSATATVGSTQGSERGSTVSLGEESARGAEEAYHDSLTTSVEVENTESILREVVDAAIRVELTIDNDGDIPFSISNLELTAQTQSPNDRRQIIPVAALVPENENLGSINIGALGDPSRGPFIFKTTSIFPQQVEELMKNPRGFFVQLANFDITDDAGNNFAFTSQSVLDRTAGITFDDGQGEAESYRVATASFQNPATGLPNGITMARALEIIGLSRYPTIRDGGNGIVETTAAATDEQDPNFSIFRPVEPRAIIIQTGSDGTIETVPAGDDILVPASYETALHTPAAFIRDGGNGIAETIVAPSDASLAGFNTQVQVQQGIIRAGSDQTIESIPGGDDVLVPAGVEKEVLVRYLDTSASLTESRFWALFASQDRPGVDLDEFQIRSGEQFDFAYVRDQDQDGVWAREEYLHGSSDLQTNTDGCNRVPAPVPCDTLLDSTEIQKGWRVQLKSSQQGYNVYSNPNQADSDRDLLLDHEELACALDPRQRDTDLDGLSDWEELNGMRIVSGEPQQMTSRDPVTSFVTYTITPYKDGNDINPLLIDHDSLEACDLVLSNPGFATDPLNADTDGDLVNDLLELNLGLNPNDSSDGPLFLDDDGDGVPNKIEEEGIEVLINGSLKRVYSNANDPDSDDDGLPDLLEHFLNSDPQNIDTDGDGLLDSSEYKGGGGACLTTTRNPPAFCVAFSDSLTNNFSTFVAECEAADQCNNQTIELRLVTIGSPQHGTNINERDTDRDILSDKEELDGATIVVNRAVLMETSDPLNSDTDNDQLNDWRERFHETNPREPDTDDDNTFDIEELALGRNPNQQDRKITVDYLSISWTSANCDNNDNEEWSWLLGYQTPANFGGSTASSQGSWTNFGDGTDSRDTNEPQTESIGGPPISFIVDYGRQFALMGGLEETSPGADDEDDFPVTWFRPTTVSSTLDFGTEIVNVVDSQSVCGGTTTVRATVKVE